MKGEPGGRRVGAGARPRDSSLTPLESGDELERGGHSAGGPGAPARKRPAGGGDPAAASAAAR